MKIEHRIDHSKNKRKVNNVIILKINYIRYCHFIYVCHLPLIYHFYLFRPSFLLIRFMSIPISRICFPKVPLPWPS